MPILYDTHMHSSFSTDSNAPMDDMVRKAMDLGLSGICITEHLDPDFPTDYFPDDPAAFQANPAEVLKTVRSLTDLLRAKPAAVPADADGKPAADHAFTADGAVRQAGPGSAFRIGFGIEFGMQPHLGPEFEAIASAHPFDFIIASQHLVRGRDPYYAEEWKGYTMEEVIGRYYEEMLEGLRKMPQWDTLGHLDYIIRYIPGWGSVPYDSMEEHPDLVDAVLEYVIRSGKSLEVNTAGYKYGLGQPHPAPSVLKRYRELGGTMITIGADAHAPQHIAFDFEKARRLLLSLGFHSYVVYEHRTPHAFSLE